MTTPTNRPRLSLSHTTMAVRDLDVMLDFYCDVLGFQVTDRGEVGDAQMAFISQDPGEHHQIVFVTDMPAGEHQFVMTDHLAFRTGSLDDLREIGERLEQAGIEGVIPIDHGNAWSLYFNDPEGNGLECFVDSPFHVAQPHAGPLDITASDEQIAATTADALASAPDFMPADEWRDSFVERLSTSH